MFLNNCWIARAFLLYLYGREGQKCPFYYQKPFKPFFQGMLYPGRNLGISGQVLDRIHIAVLTGQATDPHALVQPVIAPLEKLEPKKIVGTLFTSSKLPTPARNENIEFVALRDFAVVNALLRDAKLFKVSGRSAEPIALDGQFIMTQPVLMTPSALSEMDGHLVIAVDDSGTRYFKRLRRRGVLVVLESLNPDGTAPAEIPSPEGKLGLPRLTDMLEVVGVLFELPN